MLQKRLIKFTNIYLALLVLCFMQAESSLLTKIRRTGRKELPDRVTDSTEGVIVFGKGPKNASVKDGSSYQADYPEGFLKGHVLDVSSKERLFKRLSPALRCGRDHMSFRAFGAPLRHFTLNQEPALPLSHVPTTCGYTIEENPLRLVLHVSYDGCYVMSEDGYYNLLLRWNGVPVMLKCPKPDEVTTTFAPTPYPPYPWWFPGLALPPETTPEPTQAPAAPYIPPSFFQHYHQYPWHRHLPPPAQAPTAAPQDPVTPAPQNLWPYYVPWHLLYQHFRATPVPPQDPVAQPPSRYWPYPYHTQKTFLYPNQHHHHPQFPSAVWPYQNYWHFLHGPMGSSGPADGRTQWAVE